MDVLVSGTSISGQISWAGVPQNANGQEGNGPTFGFMQPTSSNEQFVFGAKNADA